MPFQPFAPDWDRVQVPGHEQWVWLAVEIAEIRRCAAVGDQAHDRLALLLLDHLVEVFLWREVNVRLAFQLPDSMVEKLRELDLDESVAGLVAAHVDPCKRQKISKHFDDMTKYLMQCEVLSSEERRVILRMHGYRNGAYHRDEVPADLIHDLVQAYLVLTGDLLARHRPRAWTVAAVSASGPSPTVVRPQQLPGLLLDGLEIDLAEMARGFSAHTVRRVAEVTKAVGAASLLLTIAQEEGDTEAPAEQMDLLTALNMITPGQLQGWADRAAGLARGFEQQSDGFVPADTASIVALIIRYIDLDEQLKTIEPNAGRLSAIMSYAEQQHEDEVRGKPFPLLE